MISKAVSLVLVLSVCGVWGQSLINPPIPLIPDPGIVYSGDDGAEVKFEFFGEMLCSDTFRAWPMIKQLAADYPATKFQVVVHQLALPYHRNAQLATQAFYLVNDLAVNSTWAFFEAVLTDYAFFGNGATADKSMNDVIADLGTYANTHAGISEEIFDLFFPAYGGQAIYAWKYAARRGMAGTPMYAINGIDLALNPSIRPDISEFKQVIDNLLGQAAKNKPDQNSRNLLGQAANPGISGGGNLQPSNEIDVAVPKNVDRPVAPANKDAIHKLRNPFKN